MDNKGFRRVSPPPDQLHYPRLDDERRPDLAHQGGSSTHPPTQLRPSSSIFNLTPRPFLTPHAPPLHSTPLPLIPHPYSALIISPCPTFTPHCLSLTPHSPPLHPTFSQPALFPYTSRHIPHTTFPPSPHVPFPFDPLTLLISHTPSTYPSCENHPFLIPTRSSHPSPHTHPRDHHHTHLLISALSPLWCHQNNSIFLVFRQVVVDLLFQP